MPSVEKLRAKLVDKLKELFQLDQPELDFGFYRIMHAKAQQVMAFLENDLLGHVHETLGILEMGQRSKLEEEYQEALSRAKEYGAPIPEEATKVKEAKAKLDAFQNGLTREGEVYDHLFRFFERYYEDGDFISRRYYARETEGRAAPYAIPYNGEEVKLVWANMDQYYIKSSEYFTNYSFDLRAAAAGVREDAIKKASKVKPGEVRASLVEAPPQGEGEQAPLRVHFKIVSGSEGEHGNVKASDANKRFFILHKDAPVGLNAAGELEIRFEYRADPEKTGQDGTWRAHRNAEAVRIVSESLDGLEGGEAFKELLATPAPTEKQAQRTLLGKYIEQYTARNTCDYFIHKDLGGFLKRELDFYIKNEVMHLDDITGVGVEAAKVEEYLDVVRVLRKVAGKVIEFLAQLEEYQKKLWLKKKFVVETNYCVTLDRVPEELYEEIAKNDAQREEWVRLYAIDEIEDEGKSTYSIPLTTDFLRANNNLSIDTKFFDATFAGRLNTSFGNLEGQVDGHVTHSDNYQALQLLSERYRDQVKCIYIDPPYNTNGDGFIYKDNYQHSSWCSLISPGISLAVKNLCKNGVLFSSIDDNEVSRYKIILAQHFGDENHVADIVWQKRYSPDIRTCISDAHEYILCFAKHFSLFKDARQKLPLTDFQTNQFSNPDDDPRGPWKAADFTAPGYRANQMYEIILPSGEVVVPPPGRCWLVTEDNYNSFLAEKRMYFGKDNNGRPALKRFLKDMDGMVPWTWWDSKSFGHTQDGLKESMNILGRELAFLTAKPTKLINKILLMAVLSDECTLDYFAGSGTTGHAVINLNREDGGKRKYILVEMGDHFDTVLIPRLKKVIYSKDWKDGEPVSRDTGISHCFKYIRLESYEDCLNNIEFTQDPARDAALAAFPPLREDYMLHYMLDVETKGSPSLLNIDLFRDPTAYTLKVKRPGTDEYVTKPVDLIETFNFLIGLRVSHYDMPRTFAAEFEREHDPELPADQGTKLVVKGWAEDAGGMVKTKGTFHEDQGGKWWFRKLEGWVPADRNNPDGARENVLVIWRKLTGDLEQDNLMLDCWFQAMRMNPRDSEFNTIYVNGSHNLPNLKRDGDTWKVRLIEEDFHRLMWDVQDV